MKRLPLVSKLNIPLWLFGFLILLLFENCTAPFKHLPTYDTVGEDPYGSIIKISYQENNKRKYRTTGELLSYDKDTLTILIENTSKSNILKNEHFRIIQIPKRNIKDYKIIFAESKPNGAFMISSVLSLTHGFFILLSLPVNFILGPVILEEEKYLYSFTSKKVNLDDIHQYCRFPLGLPENLDIHDLKMRPIKNQKKL